MNIMEINLNNPEEFTLEKFIRLVENSDFSFSRQFRVTQEGILYLSTVVGNLQIENLLYRLETCENSESGFSYSDKYDKNIIDRWFNAIKKNFPEPESDYIDNF